MDDAQPPAAPVTIEDLMHATGCSRATAYRMRQRSLAPTVDGTPGARLVPVERVNAARQRRTVMALLFEPIEG